MFLSHLALTLALLQQPATPPATPDPKDTKIAWLEEKIKRLQRLIDAQSGIISIMPQMREFIEAQQSLAQHEAAKPKDK